jgi:cell wall-associated NlpC family hydrolase
VKKRKVPRNLFSFLGMTYLSVLFVFSCLVTFFQKDDKEFTRDEVVVYAQQFLTDEDLREKGRILDCSGYTRQVFQHFNVELSSSCSMQYASLIPSEGTYQPGDLLFFTTLNKSPGHVGIYIGGNKFIHSPGRQKYVRVDSLTHKYWSARYMGFRSVSGTNKSE